MNQKNASRLWAWGISALIAGGCSGADSKRMPGAGSNGNANGIAGNGAPGLGSDLFGNSNSSGAGMAGSSSQPVSGGAGMSSGGGPLNVANACATGMLEAKLSPVNMFVMFDRSGSMNDNNKWPNATAALTSFFESPSAAGLRVALRFFPHDEPASGCTQDGCDAVACSQPLVPIGELSADSAPTDKQEGLLVNAIMNSAPGGGRTGGRNGGGGGGGGTPIYAALDGALRWAMNYHSMHLAEKTVVIFVTDGEPNGCDEDFNNISALAADALASSGVATYAIGLEGSSMAQMDQLARAGGTSKGIFIGNSANAEQELLAALTAIRGQTLSCDFALPAATNAAMAIDPAKVNVTFTPGAGMAATLRQVPEAADCGSAKSWHYDVAQSPSRIVLCQAACDLVQADPNSKLEILLGCKACGGLDKDCGGGGPLPPVIIE